MKVKRRLALNFSAVRIPPVVLRNIPGQILPQGTCHLPFAHGPRGIAASLGEGGLAEAQRLAKNPASK